MFGWLKPVGRFFKRVLGVVKDIVPEEQLKVALVFVEEAAVKFATNDERREWVALQLMERFGIPESIARLIVELAVQAFKRNLKPKDGSSASADDLTS